MMAPGAAPRSLARAALWPLRISFRRMRVVPVVIPVGAPFMDVVAHVVKPVSVRLIQPYRLRPELPPFVVIGNCFRRRVSPRIQKTFLAAAGNAFPFRFGRQAIAFAGHYAQP